MTAKGDTLLCVFCASFLHPLSNAYNKIQETGTTFHINKNNEIQSNYPIKVNSKVQNNQLTALIRLMCRVELRFSKKRIK